MYITKEETATKTAKKAIEGEFIFRDTAEIPRLEPRPIERKISLGFFLSKSMVLLLMSSIYTIQELKSYCLFLQKDI